VFHLISMVRDFFGCSISQEKQRIFIYDFPTKTKNTVLSLAQMESYLT
jgi:hypothetical protein